MRIRTLLADDEPLALSRMEELLASDSTVEVVGKARNGLEAVAAIREYRPQLCFLDIQMPEMDGFEVLESLEPGERPLVVFATAYDQFAMQAFDARALDYLLKPFGLGRIQETIARAKMQLVGQAHLNHREAVEKLLDQVASRPRSRMVLRRDGRTTVVSLSEIEAVEAESNTMWIHRGREAYPTRCTMGALESSLDPQRFFRSHRSWLLNLDRVDRVESLDGGVVIAYTKGGLAVPVAESRRKELALRLNR